MSKEVKQHVPTLVTCWPVSYRFQLYYFVHNFLKQQPNTLSTIKRVCLVLVGLKYFLGELPKFVDAMEMHTSLSASVCYIASNLWLL